jgi:hypothetical protein
MSKEKDDDVERKKAFEVSKQQVVLREAKVRQRLRYVWLVGSLVVTVGLGGATAYGFWITNRTPFSYVGLIAGAASTTAAAWLILRNRPNLAEEAYVLSEREHEHMLLVSAIEREAKKSLRVYRALSWRDIDGYRRKASRNRRVHNVFQGIIIVGSIVVTSLTSAGLTEPALRWGGASIAALVSVSAGFTGYFKFRERGFNQQQTADAIEKEYNAVDLRVSDYDDPDEDKVLKIYAQKVEALKEEQRKRELQLEQSSSTEEKQ